MNSQMESYKNLILSTARSDDDRNKKQEFLKYLEWGGFFSSPCSTKYHLAYTGGLLEHSLNVYHALKSLNSAMNAGLDEDDIIICSLLHDIGKMGDFGKPYYVDNMLKTGISKSQPFKTNPELIPEEHEIRSVIIANRYFALTEEQQTAILHHNGLFSKLDSSYGTHNFDKTPLCYLLHVADMYCSRFKEVRIEEEEK